MKELSLKSITKYFNAASLVFNIHFLNVAIKRKIIRSYKVTCNIK